MVSTYESTVKVFLILVLIGFFFVAFSKKVDAQVKLNEVMIDSANEWVEFYNSSPSAEFIKDYFIDDDSDFNSDIESRDKKILTSLNVQNPSYPYLEIGSGFFNDNGDKVVLFSADGQILDQYEYIKNPGKDRTLGKKPDGNGSFYQMNSPTKGSANSEIYIEPSPSPTISPSPTSTTSPTPSPSISPSPSPIPTKIPSPSPQKSPSSKPSPISSVSPEENLGRGETLGIGTTSLDSPSPKPNPPNDREFPVFAVSLIGGGLILVGFASFLFFRSYKKEQNHTTEELL